MELRVTIGDYKIVKNPDSLITIGLGSCVGIVVYDEVTKIMGMAHILLPKSEDYLKSNNPLKFADICVPKMVDEIKKNGGSQKRLRAKIAGGANMFNSLANNVGSKNVVEVERILSELNIPIVSRDVGGNKGRTLYAESEGCIVYCRTVGSDKKIL